jgi:hypothetical protein
VRRQRLVIGPAANVTNDTNVRSAPAVRGEQGGV